MFTSKDFQLSRSTKELRPTTNPRIHNDPDASHLSASINLPINTSLFSHSNATSQQQKLKSQSSQSNIRMQEKLLKVMQLQAKRIAKLEE